MGECMLISASWYKGKYQISLDARNEDIRELRSAIASGLTVYEAANLIIKTLRAYLIARFNADMKKHPSVLDPTRALCFAICRAGAGKVPGVRRMQDILNGVGRKPPKYLCNLRRVKTAKIRRHPF